MLLQIRSLKIKNKSARNYQVLLVIMTFFVVFAIACSKKAKELPENESQAAESEEVSNTPVPDPTNNIAVEAPPFTEGIFPCTDCHAYMDPNPQRRELVDMHDDISAIFDHDSQNRWCLDCHDLNNRDSLKLASGKRIGFDESYKLCGQCHGDKLRDWKVGVHGKRTGMWNGKKEYLLCVHCHNPHSPRFKQLTPEPPPVRQEDIQ